MKTFTASLDKRNDEDRARSRKDWSKSHRSKKELHQHETISGISSSEYHCLKLNSYRSDDRPYGNEQKKKWRVETGNAFTSFETLSFHKAMEKVAEGFEVREYNSRNILEIVYNHTAKTFEMFKGAGIVML